jgi:hypothetical protein
MPITITRGLARVAPEGVRCHLGLCNRLIAKPNKAGEIAGRFLCKSCRQPVEVTMKREEAVNETR